MDEPLLQELKEAGLSEREATDLIRLAHEIGEIPDFEPSGRWLAQSKARLLDRFDAAQKRTSEDDGPH